MSTIEITHGRETPRQIAIYYRNLNSVVFAQYLGMLVGNSLDLLAWLCGIWSAFEWSWPCWWQLTINLARMEILRSWLLTHMCGIIILAKGNGILSHFLSTSKCNFCTLRDLAFVRYFHFSIFFCRRAASNRHIWHHILLCRIWINGRRTLKGPARHSSNWRLFFRCNVCPFDSFLLLPVISHILECLPDITMLMSSKTRSECVQLDLQSKINKIKYNRNKAREMPNEWGKTIKCFCDALIRFWKHSFSRLCLVVCFRIFHENAI